MATYLIALLFFTADYTASEETLAAGVKGYQQRAEEVRKKAIAKAEETSKTAAAMLSAVKRGRVDASLVGTRDSAGVQKNGSWTFGTTTERAQMVAGVQRTAELWRQTAADLRTKKIWPQIAIPWWNGATTGAVGTFLGRPLRVKRVIDDSAFVILQGGIALTVDDEPCLTVENGAWPIEVIVEHDGRLVTIDGLADVRGIYQFVGTKDGAPVMRLVDALRIGEIDLIFVPTGELLQYTR